MSPWPSASNDFCNLNRVRLKFQQSISHSSDLICWLHHQLVFLLALLTFFSFCPKKRSEYNEVCPNYTSGSVSSFLSYFANVTQEAAGTQRLPINQTPHNPNEETELSLFFTSTCQSGRPLHAGVITHSSGLALDSKDFSFYFMQRENMLLSLLQDSFLCLQDSN